MNKNLQQLTKEINEKIAFIYGNREFSLEDVIESLEGISANVDDRIETAKTELEERDP